MHLKETKIRTGQASLNVFSMGNPTSKPIVLIHGLRDSARSLTYVASKLEHKYYVLLPELRGHGGSQRFHSYNMPDFLGDLYHVVDRFTDGNCALLGHSLGGHIASRYAALFPEQIKSLILVEGLGPPNQKSLTDSDELQTYRSTLISRSIKVNKICKVHKQYENCMRMSSYPPCVVKLIYSHIFFALFRTPFVCVACFLYIFCK